MLGRSFGLALSLLLTLAEFGLTPPWVCDHAFVMPTPLSTVLDICQGPLRHLAWRVAWRGPDTTAQPAPV